MRSAADVKQIVKDYIMQEFLPGENPDELLDSTEMMSLGILDSLAILKLVRFLEEKFNVTIEAHELDKEHMNTLASISTLVASK